MSHLDLSKGILGKRLDSLLKRPEPFNGIALPTVRNLQESSIINSAFGAVITSGPAEREVNWDHPNHRVWEFDDSEDKYGPKLFQVEEMIFWGAEQEDILVHCHAGMSRSTATAWGIAIAKGLDAKESLVALLDAHPVDFEYGGEKRWFCPNGLLVEHMQEIFHDNTLLDIREEVLRNDTRISHWL